MEMLLKVILFFSLSPYYVFGGKFRFDNYTLFKVLPKNVEHIKLLQKLEDTDFRYDFWNEPVLSAESVMVMSSPELKNEFVKFLNVNNLDYDIKVPNIQELIDKESVRTYTRNNVRSMQWDAYYNLDGIYSWMDDLVVAYPNILTKVIGGISYEGREIIGLKLSHGDSKRAIFIEGGIHSREWITHATVCYILNELLTSTDEVTMAAARDFDWYIFPVTNPDGYVWTHEEYRLWRKNRRPVDGVNFGIDLNRNWNNNWLVKGSSINPASNNYAGIGPFSEPETRTLSSFMLSIGSEIDMYLSFHSSGQLLLIPFGNTTEPLSNYYEAINVGRRAMGALSVRYGTPYVTGNIAEAIYEATGNSVDWAKEHLNIPLVYCYELRDRGTYGHLLPADQILPTSQETMDSVLELIHQAKRFGIFNNGNSLSASLMIVAIAFTTLFM